MLQKNISKEADKLLCLLYKTYLEKRNDGENRQDALKTGSAQDMYERYQWTNVKTIESLCWELKEEKYLIYLPADGTVYYSELTSDAIVKMENRFPDNLAQVIDVISKIKPF